MTKVFLLYLEYRHIISYKYTIKIKVYINISQFKNYICYSLD